MRLTKIEGPSVWKGSDFASEVDWCQQLSGEEVAEVLQAVRETEEKKIPLFDITDEDFRLPILGERLRNIQSQLNKGRGFAVLRGLNLSNMDAESCKRVIWGMAHYLGTPEPQDRNGSLLHSVTNTGKAIETSNSARGYETDDELKFHNDGGDVFMLLCRRVAKSGGVSKLVSVGALFNAILDERPDLAEVLQQPFYFDSRAQNTNEAKVQAVPIFTEHMGYVNVLYKRRYLNTAQRFPEVPRLTEAQIEALDLFDRLCADDSMHLAFEMQPGDIQIGNNYSVLHARTKYFDFDDADKRRHLYRLWLTLEHGRPLPEVFGSTREFGPSYRRRQQREQLELVTKE